MIFKARGAEAPRALAFSVGENSVYKRFICKDGAGRRRLPLKGHFAGAASRFLCAFSCAFWAENRSFFLLLSHFY